MNIQEIKQKYAIDGVGYSFADLKTALSLGDIKPNERMVASEHGGGMAKTAKEWLAMGVNAVNYYKPYPLKKVGK